MSKEVAIRLLGHKDEATDSNWDLSNIERNPLLPNFDVYLGRSPRNERTSTTAKLYLVNI